MQTPQYMIIHKTLRNFKPRLRKNQDRHSRVNISGTCKAGQKLGSVSPSVDMLPFSVNIPATVQQSSEILEGLTNYPCTTKFVSNDVQTPTAQYIALAQDNRLCKDSTISYHEMVCSSYFLPCRMFHEYPRPKVPYPLENPSFCSLVPGLHWSPSNNFAQRHIKNEHSAIACKPDTNKWPMYSRLHSYLQRLVSEEHLLVYTVTPYSFSRNSKVLNHVTSLLSRTQPPYSAHKQLDLPFSPTAS